MKRFIWMIIIWTGSFQFLAGQEFGFGFKAGLNLAKIIGDDEMGLSGATLEMHEITTGFNVGVMFEYRVTDYFGVMSELLYSQRGTKAEFDGPSFFRFFDDNDARFTIMGTRQQSTTITNAYLDIPVLAFGRVGPLKVSAGVTTSVLVNTQAEGKVVFEGTSSRGNPVGPFEIPLDYNYRKDEAGEFSPSDDVIRIDGRNGQLPSSLGAYYDFDEADEHLFKTVDVFLTGGLAVYFNQGFYIETRVNYSLTDITRESVDYSLSQLQQNGSVITRPDDDHNLSFQIAFGFSF
jgi:hypothetical protein